MGKKNERSSLEIEIDRLMMELEERNDEINDLRRDLKVKEDQIKRLENASDTSMSLSIKQQ